MILMNKISNIRDVIKEALQLHGINYEDITASSTYDGKTIVLAKKNCPTRFEDFIQFLTEQGFKYNSYFCPNRNRIKVDVSV